MKLGIMQPYLFPYIGYFQLINEVDKFVVYDDVNFIKQGWVNRNRILNNNNSLFFTIPLKNASSFSKINEVHINEKLYDSWVRKFIKTIQQNYKKAPYFSQTLCLVEDILLNSEIALVSDLATRSLIHTCKYIGIEKDFVTSSAVYNNEELSGKERVINICKKEGASIYFNPIGGQELYDKNDFENRGIQLNFIKPSSIKYPQFKNEFVPGLSIIDVLMFNSIDKVGHFLNDFEIV